QVEYLMEQFAEVLAQCRLGNQLGDGVVTSLDGPAVGQRGEKPLLQQPPAHRRHRAVEDRQQRAGAVAVAHRPRQFETAARDLIEEEKPLLAVGAQASQMSKAGLERLLQVEQQRSSGDKTGLRVVEAEAGKGRHAKVVVEYRSRRCGVEGPVEARRD